VENRERPIPSSPMSATSSRDLWYWSHATSPLSPPRTLDGVRQNVSQIEGPRPSSSTAPSTWNAEVATPHRNPSGNRGGVGLSSRPRRCQAPSADRRNESDWG